MTRHDHAGPRGGAPGEPLIAGPRWYRARLRLLGPFLGLVPMAVLGASSWLTLRLGDGRTSGILGLVGGVSAAPGLLVAGAPIADREAYPPAVLASVPLWLVLGLIASRRATRSPIATWRDYWREMLVLALAVVLGAIGALVVATIVLGESLVV
jgi:hypothetical protein